MKLVVVHTGRNITPFGEPVGKACVGTGTFIMELLRRIPPSALPHKYANELHANEVLLLPYYIAAQNIEKWKREYRARVPIRVVHQDILDFCWPRTPLLVYLYNPFEREMIEHLIECLQSAAKAGSRCVDVLYLNPVFGYLLTRSRLFGELWSERITMSQEDQNADPYATSTDLVSAYRFSPP